VIQAAAQVVQVAAFVVLLKVEPATQAVQPLFTVAVHVVETRVPAAHVLHAVQTRFVDTVQAVD
jgi:hypothetical protein